MESFMNQQTQQTTDIMTAIESLKTKQSALEEALLSQRQNMLNKQVIEEESVDGDHEGEWFSDPQEQGRGRGRGAIFGNQPNTKGLGLLGVVGREPQPFKHNWGYNKFEGSNWGHNKFEGTIRREPDPSRMFEVHDNTGYKDNREEIGYRGNRVPRFPKMEFPIYEGKTDPIEWIQKCEDFIEEQQIPIDAWVRQATFALQGRANSWYHNLRRMRDRLYWYEFLEECKIRFCAPMSMNPLGELTCLN
ncbi:unnamed protein product [Lactuca saligna]|uniref:Retrotransposon gag domain-containing protein n=1 Tax=Lactuca saligna TaxID=75948 RepID=A0AA35ZE45_LACSI|nr:unnamed protein product [Lactuca saligna]